MTWQHINISPCVTFSKATTHRMAPPPCIKFVTLHPCTHHIIVCEAQRTPCCMDCRPPLAEAQAAAMQGQQVQHRTAGRVHGPAGVRLQGGHMGVVQAA